MILSMVSGAGVMGAGLWMLWGRRVFPEDRVTGPVDGEHEVAEEDPARRSIRDRFAEPTRLAIGVALLLAGYHIAAWGAPETWFGVKVPKERWWMLVLGLAAAIGGSAWMDRMDRRSDDRPGDAE